MLTDSEKRFIPSFALSAFILAISAPYLSILLRDLGYSPVWVGILLGIHSGAGIAGPIVLGYMADKTRDYFFPLVLSSLLPAIVVFPLIRWVHPAASAVLLALMAFGLKAAISLIDAVTTIQIGKTGSYGKVRACGSSAFVCATLFFQLTPFLKPDSAKNIGLWIFIMAALSAAPFFILRRDYLRSAVGRPCEDAAPEPEPAGGKALPAVSLFAAGGFATIFLCSFSMSVVYTYFPLYLTEALGWNAVGLMFALAAVSEIPVLFFSHILVRRFGSLPLLALAAAGIMLRLLIWALLPYKPFILASQLLHSLCFGFFHPAAIHFIAVIFPAKKRGLGMSVYMALGSGLPALIGNMAGGPIVEAAGYPLLFILYAAVAGAAAVLCGVLYKWQKK